MNALLVRFLHLLSHRDLATLKRELRRYDVKKRQWTPVNKIVDDVSDNPPVIVVREPPQ